MEEKTFATMFLSHSLVLAKSSKVICVQVSLYKQAVGHPNNPIKARATMLPLRHLAAWHSPICYSTLGLARHHPKDLDLGQTAPAEQGLITLACLRPRNPWPPLISPSRQFADHDDTQDSLFSAI